MFATPKAKSTRDNTCCQAFVSDKGFVAVYPMESQSEFETALYWFCKQIGVPVSLVMDAHRTQRSNNTKRFCDQVSVTLRILEKGVPWGILERKKNYFSRVPLTRKLVSVHIFTIQ